MTPLHATPEAGTAALLLVAPALVPLAPAVPYLGAVRRRHDRGRSWPPARTALFVLGCALLAVSLLLPTWLGPSFSTHVAQHLLLGMLAPIALALAAPVSLLLVSLPRTHRQRMARVLHHPALAVLASPWVAGALVVGGMAALYLTPLYARSQADTMLHLAVHGHFFASGYLFAWSIAGADPSPGRPSIGARLVALLGTAAAHAALAKYLYAHGLPGGVHSVEDVRAGARLMYYGGDVAEVALVVLLLLGWYRARSRTYDRRASDVLAARA